MATASGNRGSRRRTRSRWSRWIIFVLVLVAVGFGARLSFRQYREWRVTNLVATAGGALDQGRLREASLALKQALAARPHHLEACRMMAELTDRLQVPQAIYWHRRVAEIDGDPVSYGRWVRSALQYGEPTFAEEALAALAQRGATNAEYHHLRASLNLAQKDPVAAEREAVLAVALAPTNGLYALNLAVIRLGSTNASQQAAARQALEQLAASGNHRLAATRALLTLALSEGNLAVAQPLSLRITQSSGATFGDQLQHLQLLLQTKDDGADGYLTHLQAAAANNPTQVLQLAEWLVAQQRAPDAWAWLQALTPAQRLEVPVQMAGVSCLVAQRDWNGLVAFLRDEGWDQMEFLRLAFVTRGQRELKRSAEADREWNRAVTLAAKNPEALRLLVRTVSSWDWPDQTRDLLWMLARGNSSPKNALYALYRYYQAAGDTQGLFRVLQRLVEVDAADDVVRNNLAAISLLLQVNVPASIKVAAELHQRHPNNSAFASTHAFALLRSGQAFEARKVMETLGEPALKNPPVAAYYGVILAESGAAAEARPYLELARTARLLPEEAAMVAVAAAK